MPVFASAYGLRLKFSLGLSLLLALWLCSSLFQWQALQLSERNHRVLGHLEQLPTLRVALSERSSAYLHNAPRDYLSYNRDVQIFHRDLLNDLQRYGSQLDSQLTAITQRQALTLPEVLLQLAGAGTALAQLEEAATRLTQTWQRQRTGLTEALGDNRQQPRLEWGAKLIVQQAARLAKDESAFTNAYRQVLESEKRLMQHLLSALLGLSALLLLLGILWFYRSVVRGIVLTAAAFSRVASGDFGHQIDNPRKDELGLLVQAFNQVSGRTRFVLTLLHQLTRAGEPQSIAQRLFELLQEPLELTWLGILSSDNQGQLRPLASAPAVLKQNFPVEADKPGFGQQLLRHRGQSGWLRTERLAEHVLHFPQDRLLREVLRIHGGETLLALPLQLGSRQDVLLLMLKQNASDQQLLDLLQSLAQPIALRVLELATSAEKSHATKRASAPHSSVVV
jgi:HAMP domain-containing protein